jgi:hypothetical protein
MPEKFNIQDEPDEITHSIHTDAIPTYIDEYTGETLKFPYGQWASRPESTVVVVHDGVEHIFLEPNQLILDTQGNIYIAPTESDKT